MNKKQLECEHENTTKIRFLDFVPNGSVHGPRTELWLVCCDECGKKFEERFIGD